MKLSDIKPNPGNPRLIKDHRFEKLVKSIKDFPKMMEITKGYVDSYKIGKLNHFPKHEAKFDWTDFLNKTIAVMRKNNKPFYIKNDLYEHRNNQTVLNDYERDMDYLAIKNRRLMVA